MFCVLVLGAGCVAKSFVGYLLKDKRMYVVLADKDERNALQLKCKLEEKDRCIAVKLDVSNSDELEKCIQKSDIVISLVDASLHKLVALKCLVYRKNLVTTSYISEEMGRMDAMAKSKNLIFLNEIGLDPGVDHMIIASWIDKIHKEGGHIEEIHSYGTNLPKFDYNNNPLGYKISWNLKGFMNTSQKDAVYKENNKKVLIHSREVLQNYIFKEIEDIGVFESYRYGDAFRYISSYNVPAINSITRNVLRHIGFCESWIYLDALGLFDDCSIYDFSTTSIEEIIRNKIGSKSEINIYAVIAHYLNIRGFHPFIKKLEWLGVFTEDIQFLKSTTLASAVCYILVNKLKYQENEKDMVILQQELIWKSREMIRKKVTASLVLYGSDEASAISYGVGIPAAIATKLILDGIFNMKGVVLPVTPQIYRPILAELQKTGIFIHAKQQGL